MSTTPVSTFQAQPGRFIGGTPAHSVDGRSAAGGPKHMFQSYRLVGDYEKPWLSNKAMKSTRWNDLIVGIFILSGIIGAGVIGFFTVWPYRQADVSFILAALLVNFFANNTLSSVSSTKTTSRLSTPMYGLMKFRSMASVTAPSIGPRPTRRTATLTQRVCTSCLPSRMRQHPSHRIRCGPTTHSTSATSRAVTAPAQAARTRLASSDRTLRKAP